MIIALVLFNDYVHQLLALLIIALATMSPSYLLQVYYRQLIAVSNALLINGIECIQ